MDSNINNTHNYFFKGEKIMKYTPLCKTSPLKRAFFKNLPIYLIIFIMLIFSFLQLTKEEYKAVTVYGQSMYPTIKEGDIIKYYPINEELKIGDIIIFNNGINEGYIIHRIIGIFYDNYGEYYITQGDNNYQIINGKYYAKIDKFKVREGNILGVVTKNG